MLPAALRNAVEKALSDHWQAEISLRTAHTVGGGCISNAARLTTTTEQHVFLKWARRGDLPDQIFHAESEALRALLKTGTVRVPNIIAQSGAHDEFGWLLLEWLEPARMTRQSWSGLGQSLAQLHGCTNDRFGWSGPNYIGSLSQPNNWTRDWPEFWRAQRLLPQLELATASGAMNARERRRFDGMLPALDELIGLGNAEGPSLLHGDLWNGNVHGSTGGAALIDPSIYYGHREVDLAMSALFGGFDAAFYAAYEDTWRTEPGAQRRRIVYQLYYLLVHVNLFRGSYLASTLSAVGQLGF